MKSKCQDRFLFGQLEYGNSEQRLPGMKIECSRSILGHPTIQLVLALGAGTAAQILSLNRNMRLGQNDLAFPACIDDGS
ncbi:hypothetical protein D1872_231590 [compost metagenome]